MYVCMYVFIYVCIYKCVLFFPNVSSGLLKSLAKFSNRHDNCSNYRWINKGDCNSLILSC